jgi:WD40 repeat protein
VAFSPDGTRLATTSTDGTARLWDSTTGQLIWLTANFPNNATASWSPTGNRLLSTTGDAWRYLRAACFDDDGRLLSLQPHDRYYTPPQNHEPSGPAHRTAYPAHPRQGCQSATTDSLAVPTPTTPPP